MLKRTLRRLILPIIPKLERVKIIQTVIAKKKAQIYLEIGVDQGKVFEIIHGPFKIGVDPIAAAPKVLSVLDKNSIYIQKTSDDFFEQNAKKLLGDKKIDVAFIDGLHEYQQVQRDIENTLDYLANDGVILVHDCNPWSNASAIRALSFDEARMIAKRDNYTDWDGGWTGDVWKSIVNLRSKRDDLEVIVLDCDCGIGIIRRSTKQGEMLDIANIESLEYEDLKRNREKFLNLKRPEYIYDIVK